MRLITLGILLLLAGLIFVSQPAQAEEDEDHAIARLGITGGVVYPFGDFARSFGTDTDGNITGLDATGAAFFGVTGHYFLKKPLDRRLSIMASADYVPLNLKEDRIEGALAANTFKVSGNTMSFTGGVRYWHKPDALVTPFFDIAAGMYMTEIEMEFIGTEIPKTRDEESAFGVNAGAGFEWTMADNIGLGLYTRYHRVMYSNDITSESLLGGVSISYIFR